MSSSVDPNFQVLRGVRIFDDLNNAQLSVIASRFRQLSLEPLQPLFVDREAEDDFYIIQSGSVFIAGEEDKVQHSKLSHGDFFIEEEMLYGHSEDAYITTEEPTKLLFLEEAEFYQLLIDFPQIKPWLARDPESQWLVRTRKFSWVGEDEIIAFVARKHEAIFVFSLAGPVIFFLGALAIIFAVSTSDISTTLWTTGAVCSMSLALLAVIWGVWNWIDWSNDYYIITDQRVVWVEKVVWLYESRDEAPLTTILAVNTTTTFFGRLFHYGSVIVRTFTGEITFRNLRDPQVLVAYINEYRERTQRGSERKEKREIDRELRERLGWENGEPLSLPIDESGQEIPEGPQEEASGFWRNYFQNFFTMRFEVDNVITYRKYWPTLFGKIWLPTFMVFLVVLGMSYILYAVVNAQFTAQFAETLLVLCVAFILLVLIPWWIYRYIDWRNDIYQVTDKFIFDIERRPLGTEVKKSAPVENILSLEHERVGFLGYMLNYGLVRINVGDTQFEFRNVHDPARVQQDIFNRIYALRREKEKVEAAKQRKRFVDVIEVYHQKTEDDEEDEYFDDYDEDFGVELGPDGYS